MPSSADLYPLVVDWLRSVFAVAPPPSAAQGALAHLVTAVLLSQRLRPSALMRALLSPVPVPARQRYKRPARAWTRPWLSPAALTPHLVRAVLALVPPDADGLTHLALDSVRCGRWEVGMNPILRTTHSPRCWRWYGGRRLLGRRWSDRDGADDPVHGGVQAGDARRGGRRGEGADADLPRAADRPDDPAALAAGVRGAPRRGLVGASAGDPGGRGAGRRAGAGDRAADGGEPRFEKSLAGRALPVGARHALVRRVSAELGGALSVRALCRLLGVGRSWF